MTDATIPVSREVKDRVDQEKEDGETYNRLLRRLLDGSGEYVTEKKAREIADEQITARVVSEAQE